MDDSQLNPEGRNREIIEAAQQVFSEYGYKKATMDDVAARMNITRSALYYYYKSKDDLFIAVGEHDFGTYELSLKEAIEAAHTTDERFAAFCRCYLPLRKKFRELYKLEQYDNGFTFKTHIKFRNMVSDIHNAIFIEIFRKDKKFSNIEDPGHYAAILTCSIRGILLSSFDVPVEQVEIEILELCRIFCLGLPALISSKRDTAKKG